MSGLVRYGGATGGPLARRSTRRRIDAARALDEYAHDRALELARHKLGNVDSFTASRITQGARLAMLAVEALAACPEARLAATDALIDRENAASQLLWNLTR